MAGGWWLRIGKNIFLKTGKGEKCQQTTDIEYLWLIQNQYANFKQSALGTFSRLIQEQINGNIVHAAIDIMHAHHY